MTKKKDLSTFETDHGFYEPISLLLTVKSFELQKIRKRYLASRANPGGRTGSVSRRESATGGIVYLQLHKGRIIEQQVLTRMTEPRGIDVSEHGTLAIAAENIVYIMERGQTFVLTHPWFSYIHTVKFSPHEPSRVLIASSGLDAVFELDYRTGLVEYEWIAWEHGFNKGTNPDSGAPLYLTRRPEEAKKFAAEGKDFKLITDPTGTPLPTAMRAAFINSIAYDENDENVFYTTFFHEGAVYRIERETGSATRVLDNLSNPHGGVPFPGGIFATSTASGEVVIRKGDERTIYDFSKLNGKPDELTEMEWLQNSIGVSEMILTIDSNRNSFVIFLPSKEKISTIKYEPEWAIQDLIFYIPDEEEKALISYLGDPVD